ncbi:MAG: HEAT repeat domain-containing protein [Candidatus Micrarchaeota archaeon]
MQTEPNRLKKTELVFSIEGSTDRFVNHLSGNVSDEQILHATATMRNVAKQNARKAAEHLDRILSKKELSPETQAAIMTSLGHVKDARFVDAMIKYGVSHDDLTVKRAAIVALGNMGDRAKSALPHIREVRTSNQKKTIRDAAAIALSKITKDLRAKHEPRGIVTARMPEPRSIWNPSTWLRGSA